MAEVVFDISSRYYAYDKIETRRNFLLNSYAGIEVNEYGAGTTHKSKISNVAELVEHRASSEAEGQALFRLTLLDRPRSILELGTGTGFSTMYMAYPDKKCSVYTIEADAQVLGVAERSFRQLNLENIRTYHGKFDQVLPKILTPDTRYDMILIDGHHEEEATINYTKTLLPHLSDNGIMILDDIYWSPGMQRAWKKILQQEEVQASINFYDFGIILKDPALKKEQHIKAIRWWKKPWKIGLF